MQVLHKRLFTVIVPGGAQPAIPLADRPLNVTVEDDWYCIWHPLGVFRLSPDDFRRHVDAGDLELLP